MDVLWQWGSSFIGALFMAILVQWLLKKVIKNRGWLWGITLLVLLGGLAGIRYLGQQYQNQKLKQRLAGYHTELSLLRCEFDRLEFFDCAKLDSLSVSDRYHLTGLQQRLPGFISRLESEDENRWPCSARLYKYDLLALATALRAEINCGPATQQKALLETCKGYLRLLQSGMEEVRFLAKTDAGYQPLLNWMESRYIEDQMRGIWVWVLSMEALLDNVLSDDEAEQIVWHLQRIHKAYLDIYPIKKIPTIKKINFLSDNY